MSLPHWMTLFRCSKITWKWFRYSVIGFWLWTVALVVSSEHNTHDNNNQRRKALLANRKVHVSVSAPSWPRLSESTPFCAVWCYLQDERSLSSSVIAGTQNDKERQYNEGRKQEEPLPLEWSFLDNALDAVAELRKNDESSCSSIDVDGTCSACVDGDESCKTGARLTFEQAVDLSLAAASNIKVPLNNKGPNIDMLRYAAISLQSYSPTCELHRSLARDALEEAGLLKRIDMLLPTSTSTCPPSLSLEAFVVLYPGAIILTQIEDLDVATKKIASSIEEESDEAKHGSTIPFLLPNEIPYKRSNKEDGIKVTTTIDAILYGNVASCAFQQWYLTLRDHPSISSFIVRHMGDITYDGNSKSTFARTPQGEVHHQDQKTYLQGYGARLDIRNMDYNVFDITKRNEETTNDGEDAKDDHSGSSNNNDDLINIVLGTNGSTSHTNEAGPWVAGVNLQKLIARRKEELKEDVKPDGSALRDIASSLLAIHQTQRQYEESVPKYLFEKELLSIQTTSAIIEATTSIVPTTDEKDDAATITNNNKKKDMLYTLRDIVQNMPSRARYLQQVHVQDTSIVTDVNQLYDNVPYLQRNYPGGLSSSSSPFFAVFVNGKRIPMERPSFNMFEFVQTLREEQALLDSLDHVLPSSYNTPNNQQMLLNLIMSGSNPSDWAQVLKSTMSEDSRALDDNNYSLGNDDEEEDEDDEDESNGPAADIRVDVGRGGKEAILYVNDIETDPRYRSWPTSMQSFVYAGMGMGSPSVRRNLFTMLVVLNPLDPDCSGYDSISFATQLMQRGFPIRLGLVFVSDEDVKTYRSSANHGSSIPHNNNDLTDELRVFHISTIIRDVMDRFNDGILALSILLSWQPYMEERRTTKIQWTVNDWITYYASYIAQMAQEDRHFEQEVRSIKQDMQRWGKERFDTPRFIDIYYEKTLKFVTMKRIQPGDAFFNGRPLPSGSPETFQIVLSKEMSHLTQLIMEGTITDQKPRSVYAKVLTGDNVYPQYHPMLSQTKKKYVVTRSSEKGTGLLVRIPFESDEKTNDNSITTNASSETVVPLLFQVNLKPCKGSRGLSELLLFLERLLEIIQMSDLDTVLRPKSSSTKPSSQDSQPSSLSSAYKLDVAFLLTFQLLNPIDGTDGITTTLGDLLLQLMSHIFSSRNSSLLDSILQWLKEFNSRTSTTDTTKLISNLFSIVQLTDGMELSLIDMKQMQSTFASELAIQSSSDIIVVDNEENPSLVVISLNGRVLTSFKVDTFGLDDLQILTLFEMERLHMLAKICSKKMMKSTTTMAKPQQNDEYFIAFAAVSGMLGKLATESISSGSSSGSTKRVNVDAQLSAISDNNCLIHSWGMEDDETNKELKIKITAIFDPLHDAVQRLAPILETATNVLGMPVRIAFLPRPKIKDNRGLSLSSFYRFTTSTSTSIIDNNDRGSTSSSGDGADVAATFDNLPLSHVLTLRLDVPEPWNVQQSYAIQDTDNLRCDLLSGECGDEHFMTSDAATSPKNITSLVVNNFAKIEYSLSSLLFFGTCYDDDTMQPPNGLQLTLSKSHVHGSSSTLDEIQKTFLPQGFAGTNQDSFELASRDFFSDTLVMKNLGYWQLPATPGVWEVTIAKGSRGSKIYGILSEDNDSTTDATKDKHANNNSKVMIMKDFVTPAEVITVKRNPGFERVPLLVEDDQDGGFDDKALGIKTKKDNGDDVIHVFSLATGHLYERFMKIMMLSVVKRSSSKIKFWFFENFLSPSFKASAAALANDIGCEVEYVTYKWPEWLRGQTEKQRIIWGYKILFLDVLFPLNVKKIIYVDADQVVRADLKELWDMDLKGAPYGYTPFCDTNKETLGFQFWRTGFWEKHLRGRPYHISALYVVDLALFRRAAVGDKLRSQYQQLSADPNSLANLDQDLPNYAQDIVPIFSLPQEWLWCESWCSNDTKPNAKTIDLCNNPLHKEPKLDMAKRVISGPLFKESWIELDKEAHKYDIVP